MQALHSDRLTIRSFSEDDAGFILALVNDADWLRFIGDKQVHSLDDGPLAMQARHGHSLCCVVRRSDGASLAMCGLIRRASGAR